MVEKNNMEQWNTHNYLPLLIGILPDPDMTFESFVTCKANEFPVEVARTMSEEYAPAYNPLYVYSDVGLGKTHLLSAIANKVKEDGGDNIIMLNAVDLQAEFERAERLKLRAELRDWLTQKDILLVDDIQLCESNEFFQRELFAIINRMTNTGKRVAITSDVPPTRLRGIEQRLTSRLGGGVIISLHMADKAVRLEIMKRVARDVPINEEVFEYLAERIEDNVRRLKSAIYQLKVHHEQTGVEIDIDLTRAIIPMPEDLDHTPVLPVEKSKKPEQEQKATEKNTAVDANLASRFKEMLQDAENEQEQMLALQIAISERIKHLREQGNEKSNIKKLQKVLDSLREGNLQEAMAKMNEIGGAG